MVVVRFLAKLGGDQGVLGLIPTTTKHTILKFLMYQQTHKQPQHAVLIGKLAKC